MSTNPRGLVGEVSDVDHAIYEAVAQSDTPSLDDALRRLSHWADKSKLWVGMAGALALFGGPSGRRAAVNGVASIGLSSAVTNLGFKQIANRDRPDRVQAQVPDDRHVPMPESTSFPSGHSASAFAFAEGVAAEMPWLGVPLRLAAATVAFSRVHTGVHYPGDVVIGSLIGMTSGQMATRGVAYVRRHNA